MTELRLNDMPIPEKCLILVCGIPGICKTTFGNYLANHYGFVHCDMERLNELSSQLFWSSRKEFVKQLMLRGARIVITWGFPTRWIQVVNDLRNEGFEIIWFAADEDVARKKF